MVRTSCDLARKFVQNSYELDTIFVRTWSEVRTNFMKKFAEHGEYMSNLNGVGITGRGGALGRQGRMAERGDDSGEELGEAYGFRMR